MDDRNLVTRLLKQSILTLCREAVTYSVQLEVDGLVSVTVDGRDVHIVKIHELFLKQGQTNQEQGGDAAQSRNSGRNVRQISQTPAVHYEGVAVKTEPVEQIENGLNEDKEEKNTENGKGRESMNVLVTETNHSIITSNRESPSTTNETIDAQLQKLPTNRDTDIPCKRCDETLRDVDAYEDHSLKVHSVYACRVCLAVFTSRNNMKRHVRIHTGVKPYTCVTCKESFSRNDDYKRHLLRHTYNKPFRCSVCYAGYADKQSLKTHMNKEHDANVFHTCSHCGETFLDVHLFEKHKKVHQGMDKFNCTICSFTGPSALIFNKHMLTHGPPKQFTCNHCERTFNDPFNYTNHLKLHQDDEMVHSYACCFCDLRLPTYKQFHGHELSHVHPRLHTCNVCYKQFRSPSNLKEHLMTHITQRDNNNVVRKLNGSVNRNSDNDTIHMDVKGAEDQQLELNNNTITDNVDIIDTGKVSSDGHCNDYWCTECNQGFETEEGLQNHIINTHENGPSGNDANNNEDDCHVDVVYRTPTPTSPTTSPYELATQVDDEINNPYDESTQNDDSSNTFDQSNNNPYDENTQKDYSTSPFDQETIVDEINRYPQDLTTDVRRKANVHLSPAEMTITANAIKQVMDIQRQFGVKSQTNRSTSPQTSLWDRDTPLNLSSERRPMLSSPKPMSKYLPSDRRPYGTSRNPFSLFKKPAEFQADLFARIHQRKANVPRHIDDNAMDIDSPLRDTSSTPNASLSTLFPSSSTPVKDAMGSNKKSESPKTTFSGASTSLNLKVRNPGFEKVVTPDILFKTKAPFTCEVCEETFLDFYSFDRHGVSVHRRYICSYCGKVFTSRPNRERHVRYHTGDKPYKCDLCNMAFFRGDDLKYHRTTRHPDVKPYVCEICTSQFTQAKELQKHYRMYPDHKTDMNGQQCI